MTSLIPHLLSDVLRTPGLVVRHGDLFQTSWRHLKDVSVCWEDTYHVNCNKISIPIFLEILLSSLPSFLLHVTCTFLKWYFCHYSFPGSSLWHYFIRKPVGCHFSKYSRLTHHKKLPTSMYKISNKNEMMFTERRT